MTKDKKSEVDEISYDEQEYLERTALLGLEYVLADFAREFQSAIRRWERIVWPAMIVFSLLAISGFWLIYSITEDMHRMSRNIDPEMSEHLGSMSDSMKSLNVSITRMDQNIVLLREDIDKMTHHIARMDGSMTAMNNDMAVISETMDPLLQNIAQMNQSIYAMTWNTGVMSQDMNRLNRNIGKPMRFMNNFIP
jgi:methyl-accepting chemotaxis protein